MKKALTFYVLFSFLNGCSVGDSSSPQSKQAADPDTSEKGHPKIERNVGSYDDDSERDFLLHVPVKPFEFDTSNAPKAVPTLEQTKPSKPNKMLGNPH